MRIQYRNMVVALAAILGVASINARALSTDRDQPIVIEAAAAEADDRAHVTVYRGDVIIVQGTLRISGDTVWVHYDDSNTITKAVSVGTPAKFRQLPDGKEDYTTAEAERMEYHADRDLVLLIGNARYAAGKDKISAQKIIYDSRQGRVKAGANPDGGSTTGKSDKPDRVRITITPKKK